MRRALLALALLAAAAAAVFVLTRGPAPPADRAAALVPADALAYLHVSTDPDRDEDRRLLALLRKFPSFARLRERAERLVSASFDLERDVRPWLGDEAGVALLDSGGPAANVLLLLAVRDEPRAQGLLSRAAGAQGGVEHRGIAVRRFGGVAAAFAGGFLLLGQEAAVKAAIDRHRGRGAALGPARDLPDERSLDVRLDDGGVRRVLAAQPGVVGALGALLDHPALRGVTLSLTAEDGGARVHARQARRTAGEDRTFTPELIERVPDGAAAYVGLGGLEAVEPLLARVPALSLREAARTLRGEVALSVTPALPAPVVTLIAKTRDADATRAALSRLRGEVAQLLVPADEDAAGQVPTFEERRVGDVTAFALALGPDSELLYAIAGGRLVISTAAAGVQRAIEGGDSLRDGERFRDTAGDLPDRVEALTFLDLSQLLTLGDQAGIDPGSAFRSARDDLSRVRALSAVAQREGTDTTAELFLEIP